MAGHRCALIFAGRPTSANNHQRRHHSERRRGSTDGRRLAATAVATSVATAKSTRQTQLPISTRLPPPQPTSVAQNAKGDSSRHATLSRNHHGAQTEAAEPLQSSVAKNASGDSSRRRDSKASPHRHTRRRQRHEHHPRRRRTRALPATHRAKPSRRSPTDDRSPRSGHSRRRAPASCVVRQRAQEITKNRRGRLPFSAPGSVGG